MRHHLLFSLTALLALTFTACQSKTYRISGTVTGLADGDTLYISTDLSSAKPKPINSTVVKDGHFTIEGETDSAQIAIIYTTHQNDTYSSFFLEPGYISITLTDTPGGNRIGGTHLNNKYQQLRDSVFTYGKEINRIAEHVYGNTVDAKAKQEGMDKIEQITNRFKAYAAQVTEKNIDNEFGYFMITNYADLLASTELSRLFKQLPAHMRQRKEARLLEAAIIRFEKNAVGVTIEDFSMQTPEGGELSAMSVISQHRVTVIDFWASWCGPCRQEMPFMLQMYNTYKDKGLGILGVSLDKNHGAWTNAIKQLKLPWPQMSDLKGWENAAAKRFNVSSIPHTIVVDQKGKILQSGLRRTQLERFVAEQLK